MFKGPFLNGTPEESFFMINDFSLPIVPLFVPLATHRLIEWQVHYCIIIPYLIHHLPDWIQCRGRVRDFGRETKDWGSGSYRGNSWWSSPSFWSAIRIKSGGSVIILRFPTVAFDCRFLELVLILLGYNLMIKSLRPLFRVRAKSK